MASLSRQLARLKKEREKAVNAPEVRKLIAAGGGGGGGSVAWADVTGKPSTFTPSTHGHAASDITDFDTAVDARLRSAAIAWVI